MIEILIDGVDFTKAVSGELTITDSVDAACRDLSFSMIQNDVPKRLNGKTVELLLGGERWFKGNIRSVKSDSGRRIDLKAYDPLFFFTRFVDDYYFKNQTANQIIASLAAKCGVKTASLESTAAVFPQLYYSAADPDKIATDVLARTRSASGKKYWYRYCPAKDGIILFERRVPEKLWSFKSGINLLDASKSESVESLYSSVKLVQRESGAEVVKINSDAAASYGLTQKFEEVNGDVPDINAKAAELLADSSKPEVSMSFSAVNPKGMMGQFFAGDAVYIEEPISGIGGGYYLRSVTQKFTSPDVVEISADVVLTPDLPSIEFSDADKQGA